MKVVMASGYFDPIHVGNTEYLEMAKSLGNKIQSSSNLTGLKEIKSGALVNYGTI
jgi:glycerol-3-phosphate cytidylyltransferase-like family protein